MKANLHFHSYYSDGSLSPAMVAARGAGLGLKMMALTDHDTMGGVPEFMDACAMFGIAAIPACEIDCVDPEISYDSELLAYFPAGSYGVTLDFLAGLEKNRIARMEAFLAKARALWGNGSLRIEEMAALRFAGLGAAWRGDSVALIGKGLSFSKVDLFHYLRSRSLIDPSLGYPIFKRDFVARGPLAIAEDEKPRAEEVARIIRSDGGYVVIPHPGHEFGDSARMMRREEARLVRMLARFAAIGVEGIELYHYGNAESEAINSIVREKAARHGFFFTYGSDCHGPGSGKDTLGLYSGDFEGFPAREGAIGNPCARG
jgi:hypothetical protein